MYKAEFNLEVGIGTSNGEVQANSLGAAMSMIKNELCESYRISKDFIKSIEINES